MKRRRPANPDEHNPVPEQLRRFTVGQWPGGRPLQQAGAYLEALAQWQADHPDVDADRYTEPMPDVEFNPELDAY